MGKSTDPDIGKKLRLCRENCGLSQNQVANVLGIDRTTYTYYESGRSEPNLTTLVKLANIFCVDVATLLPQEDDSTVLRDRKSAPNPIYSLTNAEQTLLISFRLLSSEKKEEFLAKITNMVDSGK